MSITIPAGGYPQYPQYPQVALSSTVPVLPIPPTSVSMLAAMPPPTSHYAAPSTSVRIPSYTPPPVPGSAAHQLTSSFVMPPLAPPSAAPVYAAPTTAAMAAAKAAESKEEQELALTRGFPDPKSIEEQKEAYSRSLQEQLEQGNLSLQRQNAERKKQLYEAQTPPAETRRDRKCSPRRPPDGHAAEQQKQALLLHMEQQVKIQEMALDEQTSQAMMGLKKAALDQRAALDQQAAGLVLEYQQRKTQEEFAATQAEMKKQYLNSHSQLQFEATKFYSESQSKVQQELQRQQKERAEKLGDAASLAMGTPTPRVSQGVVPAQPVYGAPARGYSALPSMQQVPMQPIAHYM
eukprot:TRINITY_DN7411_c0_g1_i1.p1 TRINITY_DN7411_c0_g1~~TRINITY_DN7411_c0_g1_i1.p1  ORF type:complete len:381 (-),score=73.89 TRINITY_DN7411_c0_g1_i1:66-1112(-)